MNDPRAEATGAGDGHASSPESRGVAAVHASLRVRLGSLLYEAVLLTAIAFIATSVFQLAMGGVRAEGWTRTLLQLFLVVVFGLYFVWCWLRGGQTLPMKAWRIRLVNAANGPVRARQAGLRFLLATLSYGLPLAAMLAGAQHREAWLTLVTLFVATTGLAWALVDRDRQFLHDRLAGTRLIRLPR